MSTLKIHFSKKPDGSSILHCERDDGSATWQRHKTEFFVHHDLTHLAVESTLGLRYGFYGLLACGWNVSDFGSRELPEHAIRDAMLAEAIAGLLDQERATGVWALAADFNVALEASLSAMGHEMYCVVTQSELDAIRKRFMELIRRWGRTGIGDQLTWQYE